MDELFESRYQRIVHTTRSALVTIAGESYWIPKTHIDEVTRTHITMTVQIARERGLLPWKKLKQSETPPLLKQTTNHKEPK